MADCVRDSLSLAYDLKLVPEGRHDAPGAKGTSWGIGGRNEVDLGVRVKMVVADTRLRTAR